MWLALLCSALILTAAAAGGSAAGAQPAPAGAASGRANEALPPALPAAARLSVKKLNRKDSCKYCEKKCQDLDRLGYRVSYCRDAKTRLTAIRRAYRLSGGEKQHGYSKAVMSACSTNFCRSITESDWCGLVEPGRRVTERYLEKVLAREEKDYQALKKRFRQDVAPKFKHKDYMKRRDAVVKHRADAKASRDRALNARAEHHRLRARLRARWYRRSVFDMHKWGNETEVYGTTTGFWEKMRDRLNYAVRTSPLQVERLSKQVKAVTREMLEERDEVAKRKRAVESLEEKEEQAIAEEDYLRRRIADVEKSIEGLENDKDFLHKIGREIQGVLERILKAVKSKKIKVGCEPEALAKIIAEYST